MPNKRPQFSMNEGQSEGEAFARHLRASVGDDKLLTAVLHNQQKQLESWISEALADGNFATGNAGRVTEKFIEHLEPIADSPGNTNTVNRRMDSFAIAIQSTLQGYMNR